MLLSLFRLAQRIISSWWKHDRIRASPREGRLLRIQPGDLLTIGKSELEVQSRSVLSASGKHCLKLECVSGSGSVVVFVTIHPDEQEQRVAWTESGHYRESDPKEVLVWSRSEIR